MFRVQLVLLLGLCVGVLIRRGLLKALHAAGCILLGFLLAGTSLAPGLTSLVRSLIAVVASVRF
ncbi:DUF2304 domain-containing protein [Streptomyces sp. NPDC057654]|uniref:DUF2304 domain-containing protein n=1 Tax=Streptomyces sp. NPDC057654 TaxID=3346196 RepID=UPI00368AF965